MVIALESSLPPFIYTKNTSQSIQVSVLLKKDCQSQSIYKSSSPLSSFSSLRCHSGASSLLRCHSGASSLHRCHSGASSLHRCHSGASSLLRCHSGASSLLRCHSGVTPVRRIYKLTAIDSLFLTRLRLRYSEKYFLCK